MQALAKAVTALQASIDSFRGENRASIASLQETLNAHGQRITDMEDWTEWKLPKLHWLKKMMR